ncbi:MAG: oligosaccharide flippase family protein, partial [Pseudomonadota bacterium]
PSTVLDLIVKVATFTGTVGVALIYPTYWALLCGVLAAAIASSAFTFIMAKERPGWSLASFKTVFSFSAWLGLAALARAVMSQSDRLILGIGFSIVMLGYYMMAVRIIDQIIQALQQPINWALYSGFSKVKDDPERLQRNYKRAHAAMAALLVPASMGLLLVAEPFVLTFLGEKWQMSILFCQVTALIALIMALPGPSWPLAMSLAETRLLFWRTVVTLGIRLAAQLIGIITYGIPGFLVGCVVAVAINNVIAMQVVKHLINATYVSQLLNVWRPVAASMLMIPAVLLTAASLDGHVQGWLSLGAQVAAGLAAYGLTTLVFWTISGFPEGPERMVIKQAELILRKLRILPELDRPTESRAD